MASGNRSRRMTYHDNIEDISWLGRDKAVTLLMLLGEGIE